MSDSLKSKSNGRLKNILASFFNFKKKDVEIRTRAKIVFEQTQKRINEDKIKEIKEKISKIN